MAVPSGKRDGPAEDCADACAVAEACSLGLEALCARTAQFHAEKAEVCDKLEAVADSLPNAVDRFVCLAVAVRLTPLFRDAHRYEEDLLFPAFALGSEQEARLATVGRLKSEHVYDESAAAEISEELLRIGHGGAISNPEALGFMLRAFFDTVRRHTAFEREHIFPATRLQSRR